MYELGKYLRRLVDSGIDADEGIQLFRAAAERRGIQLSNGSIWFAKQKLGPAE